MKQHPLTNEKTLETWLKTMSCNGCFHYVDKKCTHKDAEENIKDKILLVEDAIKQRDEFSLEWAKNIDDYYLCPNYNNMNLR